MTRSTIAFGEQGIVDCKVEAIGLAALPDDCETLLAFVRSKTGQPAEPEAITEFGISETYFYPVPAGKAATPPRLRGANQVAQQISEIVIDSGGRVSDCKGISYSGTADPEEDACLVLRNLHFVPTRGDASLVATVVMTAYVRANTVT